MSTIFSRIADGEIPAAFVFREEHWFGILDLYPAAPGHLLVIPSVERAHLHELPDEHLASLGPTVARATDCLYRGVGCDAVSVLVRARPPVRRSRTCTSTWCHATTVMNPTTSVAAATARRSTWSNRRWTTSSASSAPCGAETQGRTTMDLAAFQAQLAATYGSKDRARGIPGTFMYFTEEVGELAEALREPDDHDLAGEFADCLAWLTSLAHLAGVDLAAATVAKYGTGCSHCLQAPCVCRSKP